MSDKKDLFDEQLQEYLRDYSPNTEYTRYLNDIPLGLVHRSFIISVEVMYDDGTTESIPGDSLFNDYFDMSKTVFFHKFEDFKNPIGFSLMINTHKVKRHVDRQFKYLNSSNES